MSNAAGALSSMVMTLPLIAVPCLAVFGLPSIGPAAAEAEADESLHLGVAHDLTAGDFGHATAPMSVAQSEFKPIVDAGDAPPSPFAEVYAADRSAIAPTSDHRGAVANTAVGLEKSAENVCPASAAGPVAPETASCERIVAKLTSLGVQGCRLTNGELPGEFHFTCGVTAVDTHVTRRFEAEGDSPVAAADDVLEQVEQWLATR